MFTSLGSYKLPLARRGIAILMMALMMVLVQLTAPCSTLSEDLTAPLWYRPWYQAMPEKGYLAGDPEHFIWGPVYFVPMGNRGFEMFDMPGGATTLEFSPEQYNRPPSDRGPRLGQMQCQHTGASDSADLVFHNFNFTELNSVDGKFASWFRADLEKKDAGGLTWHERWGPQSKKTAEEAAASPPSMLPDSVEFVRKVVVDVAAKCVSNAFFWIATLILTALVAIKVHPKLRKTPPTRRTEPKTR